MKSTLLYIHGIGDQPSAGVLKREYDLALLGAEAAFTRLVHWSDVRPSKHHDRPNLTNLHEEVKQNLRTPSVIDHALMHLTERTTQALLRDVYDYFYNPSFRRLVLMFALGALADEPKVVIGHSLGTVILYEALILSGYHAPQIITLGSPLALENVKAELRRLHNVSKLPLPKFDRWLNCADLLDPVATDKSLANDYNEKRIVDWRGRIDSRNPHDANAYLRLGIVKQAVADQLMRQPDAAKSN